MMVTPEQIKNWIMAGLEDAQIDIEGDGQHFFATIVTHQFEGKSRIQRHQMVYQTLGDRMQSEIHALSMTTLTPQQYIDRQNDQQIESD